jgi:tape measure domain-containing protein
MPPGKHYPLSVLLTAIDRVSRPVQRVHNAIQRLTAPFVPVQNALKSLSQTAGIDRLKTSFVGVKDSLSEVGAAAETSFRRATYVVGLATGAAYLFNRQFIGTASTFENLEVQLEGLEGTSEKAKAALAFIKQMAVATPFETADIAKTFTIMRGFGMDPTGGALQAIVDQVAKVGGSGEKLTGIALQIGQAFSKGRLQAQDANILIENSVPVWLLLQRAIARVNKGQQVSIGQLREWSEDGKLGVKAITLLIEQMGLESKGASERMMGTWTGMVSRLSDFWTFFKLQVMELGPFKRLKGFLDGLLGRLNQMSESGELDRIAESWATRLVELFTWIETRGVPMAVSAFQTIGRWLKYAADLTGGWENLLKFGLGLFIGGPLLLALGGLIASIVSLGIAIGMTPIGWFIAGMAGFAAAATTLTKQWEPVSAFFVQLWKDIRAPFDGFHQFLMGVFTADIKRALGGIANALTGVLNLTPGLSFVRGMVAAGRPVGAAGAVASAAAAIRHEAYMKVDFANMPRGTRVTSDPANQVMLDITRGYSMQEAR